MLKRAIIIPLCCPLFAKLRKQSLKVTCIGPDVVSVKRSVKKLPARDINSMNACTIQQPPVCFHNFTDMKRKKKYSNSDNIHVKGLCQPRRMRALMRSTLKSMAQPFQIPSESQVQEAVYICLHRVHLWKVS